MKSSTAEVTQPGQWQVRQMEHLIVGPGIASVGSEGKWTVVTCGLRLFHAWNAFPFVVKICIWITWNVLFLSGKGTFKPAGSLKKLSEVLTWENIIPNIFIVSVNTNGSKPYRSGKNDSWQEIHCVHTAGTQLTFLFWDNTQSLSPSPSLSLHFYLISESLSEAFSVLSFIFTVSLKSYYHSLSAVEMEINGISLFF